MRVLEVGSDKDGGLLNALAPRVREVLGINIVGNPVELAENARFERNDIRDTGYADRSFDLVVSYAVFEHVRDMPLALREIRRVLKPGGEFISEFGPIWSCMWGHHLWVIRDGKRFTYPNGPYLPPYCHLLMSPPELRAWLGGKVAPDAIEDIVEFVFRSEDQNRLFFRDYVAVMESAGFEVVELVGQRNLKQEAAYMEGHGGLESYLARLEARFGENDYLSSSIRLRLRRP